MLYPNEIPIEKPSRKLLTTIRAFVNRGSNCNEPKSHCNYEFTPFKNAEGEEDFTGGWCRMPSGYFTHWIDLSSGGNAKKVKGMNYNSITGQYESTTKSNMANS